MMQAGDKPTAPPGHTPKKPIFGIAIYTFASLS